MLQLLLERGQSYDDLASILGVGPDEVRTRARTALTDLAGADPDRNVALTDYLLGQADPIDRADAVRHLKDDPEDLALVTELAQSFASWLRRRSCRGCRARTASPALGVHRRRLPKPLKKLAPAPKESADGEPSPPRTTLSRRQTQGIVVAACATVLVAVGVLAIAGVFNSSSSGSTTTSTSNPTPPSGTVQGYPLLPIAAANNKGQGAKLDSNGNFEDSIPIPTAVQSILPNVQAVAITLANNTKVAKSIQTAVQNKQAILTVEGQTDFIGVVGSKKGKVFPIRAHRRQEREGIRHGGAGSYEQATLLPGQDDRPRSTAQRLQLHHLAGRRNRAEAEVGNSDGGRPRDARPGRGRGAAAAPAQPWEPPAGARWQYQLESSDKSLKSTGGIDVNICQPPAGGGPCVRPQVFDIDLYEDGQVSGNDHTVNTAAVNAIHRRGGHAVCYLSAGTPRTSAPTTTSTSSSTAHMATA